MIFILGNVDHLVDTIKQLGEKYRRFSLKLIFVHKLFYFKTANFIQFFFKIVAMTPGNGRRRRLTSRPSCTPTSAGGS
jgi:hypothetical protein